MIPGIENRAGNSVPGRRDIDTRLNESVSFIRDQVLKACGKFEPSVGIILGTGLGGLVRDVNIKHRLDYSLIPNFPVSTVESHHGNLIFGDVAGRHVLIMQGRFHHYEGYSIHQVAFPVRIMYKLGIRVLIVSNACGALNPLFKRGDLMIMRDHINFFFRTPVLNGENESFNGRVYDEDLIELAERAAREHGIDVRKGVYLSLKGPCLETRSEYRMLRNFGADVVGMSTIPEALLSRAHGIRVLGFSIVTDVGFPDSLKPAVLDEILETASQAEPKLTLLTKKVIEIL